MAEKQSSSEITPIPLNAPTNVLLLPDFKASLLVDFCDRVQMTLPPYVILATTCVARVLRRDISVMNVFPSSSELERSRDRQTVRHRDMKAIAVDSIESRLLLR